MKPASEIGRELVLEARRWIGVKERGGDNKGPEVEIFQRVVDGIARGEAWCACWVQMCMAMVSWREGALSLVHRSESVREIWEGTPVICRVGVPQPGDLILWRKGETRQGHIEIVSLVISKIVVEAISGNTGPGAGIVREGDGIYAKKRDLRGAGEMKLLGFIRPFV